MAELEAPASFVIGRQLPSFSNSTLSALPAFSSSSLKSLKRKTSRGVNLSNSRMFAGKHKPVDEEVLVLGRRVADGTDPRRFFLIHL